MSIPDPELLSIAVRAWTEPAPGTCRECWRRTGDPARTVCERCAKRGAPAEIKVPRYMLVIDFETTTDRVQLRDQLQAVRALQP